MKNVQLVQVNFAYGDNVFVPYSVGSIQAYCEANKDIKENFRFQNALYLRDDPVTVVRQIPRPDVLGLSCYVWNWEYNLALARAIREAYPSTLVVLGGTHVPDASEDFFRERPYVDLLVHHEGELPFAEILQESLSAKPDYRRIPGLSVRVDGDRTYKTAPRGRVGDLSILPSPYVAGVFDFMLGRGFCLNVTQETNRGCPYKCEFCDWGGATYDKIFQFSEERLLGEFEWFGRHHAEYLFSADANYGILPRDHALTQKMIEIRSRHHGYPRRFRMCTAKNSNDKVFQIVKMLSDADMNKGATLSFQSMDENTLEIVRRRNIKIDKFSELMDRYRDAGIATYTELIMGMPGETYATSKAGIDTLLNAQGDAVNLYVYVCTMLPNSGMSLPAYVEKYGIEAVRMPILLAHSTPSTESVTEFHTVVIGTASMSPSDWQRTYLFYWAVQCFHCLGLTQNVAIFFRNQFGIDYSDFYEKILEYFADKPETLIGQQISRVSDIVSNATTGGRLDVILPAFGEIYWPLEEASFLEFVTDKNRFYSEMGMFLRSFAPVLSDPSVEHLVDHLLAYQSAMMIDPIASRRSLDLDFDFHSYFQGTRDPENRLAPRRNRIQIRGDQDFAGDLKRYAQEVVWYGRKGGKFHHTNIEVVNL